MLAICHTAVINIEDDGSSSYTATSPDEFALVNFAKFVGVEYYGVDENENI